MSLHIKVRHHQGIPIVSLSGNISGRDVVKIQQKLDSLQKGLPARIVIELTGADYIDSHGLGVLLFCWKTMQSEQRELIFLDPAPVIVEMLESTRLSQVIKSVKRVEEL
jgi:anti-anti-sigma factor